MPLYDYRCSDCGKDSELLVSSMTTPVCPACDSRNLVKQLSLPAPVGQSAGLLAKARAQAAREGHFSHYKASEKPRLK
jgi:putative FmdB family regulatory protein